MKVRNADLSLFLIWQAIEDVPCFYRGLFYARSLRMQRGVWGLKFGVRRCRSLTDSKCGGFGVWGSRFEEGGQLLESFETFQKLQKLTARGS
jgi:hypothetical protein